MSLPESEEILSAIKQLQEKMKTEQGIFEKANEDIKLLQKYLEDKQTALDTLKDNLQEEDNYALELLGKLWKQQEKIKGHLAAQSADAIIQAVQEQNEFIDLELELIKQQYENIALNLEICREFEQFLYEDGQDTSHRSIEHKEAFAKFLEGSELLKEDDKKELLEKNSQLMTELNASMQNLEKRDKNLIEQKKELQKKDLADNLTVDAQPILQELFKERQAEIEKDIKAISEQEPILAKQYENIILQEKEIKTIQDEIDAKTKIIEQSKQKEEQLFEELKQLEQKSYPPLSSAKQQEGSVSQYSILQERANDAEASVKRQIEINELIKQQKELTSVEKARADNLDQQLIQLQLSTKQEIQAHQKLIDDLQDEIIGLKGEKEQKQFSMPTNEKNWADELQELSESDGSLSDQIDKLTSENDNLRAKLEETEKNAKEQLLELSGAKDLEYSKAKENYAAMLKEQSEAAAAELQTINEELSKLKSEQQEKQAELQKTKAELTNTREELVKAEELHGQESKQAKELQEQVEELTEAQHQLTTEFKKTREEKESQIKALTEAKEAANSELQVAKENYAAMLKEQSEAAVAKLQTINEELSQLKSEQQESRSELEKKQQELITVQESLKAVEQEYGVESKQAKKLQDQVEELTEAQHQLTTNLKETREGAENQIKALTEAKEAANSELQVAEVKYEAMLKGQSEVAAVKLQTINEELSKLKSEQQESRSELEKKKQELITVQESLKAVEQKYGVESKQAKKLQDQLGGLTNENNSLKTQLEEIKKDTKNQLETLSAAEELKYTALVTKQKGDIDELWRRLEVAQEQAQRIQKDEQARVTELRDKDVRIAALESQNAALLSQLEKLQIKPEAYEVGIQTDKIAGKSIGTETETITKEFRAVDSQTDNRQKLYQSVGTEYRPVMDSGVSVDKVLVQDKTKGNVYDDDKILQAFKELSREQVQPIVNKFSLQSTSSFAQFAQENVGRLSEAFRDSNVLREIENIEQRGYTDIHKKFAAEYKDIAWQENIISPESGKSFNLKQNGKDVVTINETTLSYDVSHDDKNAKYKTREGEEIKNARMVNIPLSIDMQGACHMSFAVQDTNGRNISKEDAVYLTAHYKNGKLVHLTKPTEIFSCSDNNKSPLYLKRKGKTYTLPVDKSTLEQLEQEVLKNKGEYVGIVKNAQGNIRVNSAAVHGLQPDRVTADPLFKDASQLLHDANATPALDGSLDMKGLTHKKPNRNVGGSRNP
ncbi:Sca4 family protein [Candidatus Tisiphia endosymbiont of Dascillus cervinus]|uniref:Sca4 family protein n=1 Tax=Candidatus Tisiphia endosymbiont of Dascillus cervinus TaxID=3066253 RepID=UPI00312C7049